MENWCITNFNGQENYAMEFYKIKRKKVSVASFKRILYEKFINYQKASSLRFLAMILRLSSINVCICTCRYDNKFITLWSV